MEDVRRYDDMTAGALEAELARLGSERERLLAAAAAVVAALDRRRVEALVADRLAAMGDHERRLMAARLAEAAEVRPAGAPPGSRVGRVKPG